MEPYLPTRFVLVFLVEAVGALDGFYGSCPPPPPKLMAFYHMQESLPGSIRYVYNMGLAPLIESHRERDQDRLTGQFVFPPTQKTKHRKDDGFPIMASLASIDRVYLSK